jgi:hypothetical protein
VVLMDAVALLSLFVLYGLLVAFAAVAGRI